MLIQYELVAPVMNLYGKNSGLLIGILRYDNWQVKLFECCIIIIIIYNKKLITLSVRTIWWS